MFGFKLKGQWAKAQKIAASALEARVRTAMQKSLLKEGHFLAGKIKSNISSAGGVGGQPFAPLSPNTIAIRRFLGRGGGTKPLNQTGALRGSITVQKVGGGAVFVGVQRSAGKGRANIADIHEFGRAWQQVMTDRQRRFLMAALRSQGAASPGRGGGVLSIRIPARPFVGPIIQTFGQPAMIEKRFFANMAKELGGDLGSV